MDNVFRAMRQVRRIINANAGRHSAERNRDKFLTLTFAENMTDIQQANRHFHNFVKKLRYYHGAFEYLGVPQIQWERYEKYGVKVWHYHVAVFGLPYVRQNELVETWGHGTVSIEAMESYENPSSYVWPGTWSRTSQEKSYRATGGSLLLRAYTARKRSEREASARF